MASKAPRVVMWKDRFHTPAGVDTRWFFEVRARNGVPVMFCNENGYPSESAAVRAIESVGFASWQVLPNPPYRH